MPETTSAEAIDRYAVGRKIAASQGPAWKDVRVTVLALPPSADLFTMPAVTEPFIVWTTSGEAETQERENNGPWLTSRVKKGSMFLTAAGAPYDFRYRTLTPEPYEVVLVLLSVPLFNEALREVFGANAANARLLYEERVDSARRDRTTEHHGTCRCQPDGISRHPQRRNRGERRDHGESDVALDSEVGEEVSRGEGDRSETPDESRNQGNRAHDRAGQAHQTHSGANRRGLN